MQKFGHGAAMPRAGPAKKRAQTGPRSQARARRACGEGIAKEGGKKLQICRRRAGRCGGPEPRRGGVVTSAPSAALISGLAPEKAGAMAGR